MYLYLKVDKTQPFTQKKENKKKKLNLIFEQLSNQKVSAVSLDTQLTVREYSHDDGI